MRSIFKRITCLFLALLTVVSLLPVMPLLTEAACSHSYGKGGKCTKCSAVFDFMSTRKEMSGILSGFKKADGTQVKIWPMDIPYSADYGGKNLLNAKGDKISYTGSVQYIAQVKNGYGNLWYEVRLEDGRIGYAYADEQNTTPTPKQIIWISKEIPPTKTVFSITDNPAKNVNGTTISSVSGYPLKSVTAAIKRVEANGTETVLSDFSRTNLSGNTFSFPRTVDYGNTADMLSFGSLKGKAGLYVYEIVATATPPAGADAATKAACKLTVRYPFSIQNNQAYLILHRNDGTGAKQTIAVNKGGIYIVPTQTRDGYTFLGWADSPGAVSAQIQGKTGITMSVDRNLYAVWSRLSYTVTYDSNGGYLSPANQVKDKGKSLTLTSTEAKRTGYVFQGWAKSKTASTADYPKGKTNTYMEDKSIILYAVWKPIQYKIAYDANDNNPHFPMGTTTHTYDQAKSLKSNSFCRLTYEFSGWNTKADGSGMSYKDAESVKNLSSTDGATVTLYAQWKKKVETPKETQPASKETTPKETTPKATEPPKNTTPVTSTQTVVIPNVASNQKRPASYTPHAKTYADVEAIVMDYWNTVTDYGKNTVYWNKHLRGKNITRTEPFLNTITGTSCAHAQGCTSNGFWYSDKYLEAQCEGFSYYMAWVVFGKLHTDPTVYTKIDRTALSDDYEIKPGDILRAPPGWKAGSATHSMFVYKVEGGKAYYIECNYPGGCQIYNARSLDVKEMVHVIRNSSGAYVLSSRAVPSVKTYNIKFNANKPSGAKNPTGTMADQKAYLGAPTTLAANAFKIEGYVFDGWKDSKGNVYKDKAAVTDLCTTEGATVTLYAMWVPEKLEEYLTNVEVELNQKYATYNVYEQPYSSSATVGDVQISAGARGIATKIAVNSSGNCWYRVSVGNVAGWIPATHCDVVGLAPNAVTVSSKTELDRLQYSSTGAIDLTEVLTATDCTMTLVTGALRSGEKTIPSKPPVVSGSFTTFSVKSGKNGQASANNNQGTINYALAPIKQAVGLYTYTLDVAVKVKVVEGNAVKDQIYGELENGILKKGIRVLTDPFEVYNGTANSFKITLDVNAENPGKVECSQKEILAYSGKAIGKLPEAKLVGQNFLGWYTAKTGGIKVTESKTFTQNTTIYAHWEAVDSTVEKESTQMPAATTDGYDIIYKSNTTDAVKNMPDNDQKIKGETYTISTKEPTRVGYLFREWSTAEKPTLFSGTEYDPGDTYKKDEKLTLYAQWDKGYAVYYDKNGGTGNMEPSTFERGKKVNLAKNTFTRDKYVFLRWNTKADGSGDSYSDGEEVKNLAAEGGSVKLYAQWTNTYQVLYHYNVSWLEQGQISGEMEPSFFEMDKDYNLAPNPYTRVNENLIAKDVVYVFLGWNTKADGTGTFYEDQAKVRNLASAPGKEVNLYAQWAERDEAFTVIYNKNGGTGTMKDSVIARDTSTSLRKNTFTRTGYAFEKWTTASNGTGSSYNDGQSVKNLAQGGKTITLYAQWKSTAKVYTVQYVANGGTGTMQNSTHTVGVASKLSPNGFTRPGYVFKGWNTKADGSEKQYGEKASVLDLATTDKAVVKLYAQWQEATEAEYLKSCTLYPSYMNLTVTNGSGNIMSLPVAGGTAVRQLTAGEQLVSTALYENSKGEFWYQIRANRDGKVGYVYAGDAASKGIADKTVNFGVTLNHSSIYRGYACDILGSISARNNILYQVVGVLDDSDPKTEPQTQIINSDFDNIQETDLNKKLAFAQLSRGKGTLNLSALLRSAYSSDGKKLLWEEYATEAYSLTIRVIGIYDVSFEKNTTDDVLYMPNRQNKTDETDLLLPDNVPERTGYTFQGWAKDKTAKEPDYLASEYLREDTDTGNLTLYAVWNGPNEYTITFDANGGTGGPETATATHWEPFYYPANNPTLAGCTFLGWSKTQDVDGNAADAEDYLLKQPVQFTEDTTLYAVWRHGTVTITYYHNDGSGQTTTESILASTAHTLPAADWITRDGYTLLGYAETAGATEPAYLPGSEITIGANKILYLVWKPEIWTVTYNANGGSGAPEAQEKRKDVDLVLSSQVPVRMNDKFLGWAASADSKDVLYRPGDTYTANADITLYAVWEATMGARTFTVTYDANGGVGAPESQTKYEGVDLQVSQVWPTRDGYYCMGWATTPNAVMPNVGGLYTEDRDVTFYAVWREDSSSAVICTVTFDANGGQGGLDEAEIAQGEKLMLWTDVPSREGYEFLGWAETADALTPTHWVGNAYTIHTDMTLYAVWQRVYTVSFDANGGFGSCEPSSKYKDIPLELPWDMVREGYSFLGWAETADAETPTYLPGDTYTENADITLYAIWKTAYTISYASDILVEIQPGFQLKRHGEPLTLTGQVSDYDGHVFKGWRAEINGESVIFQTGDTFHYDTDATLWAIWEAIRVYDVHSDKYFETGYGGATEVAPFDTEELCHVTITVEPSERILQSYNNDIQSWFAYMADWGTNCFHVPLQMVNGKLEFYVSAGMWPLRIGNAEICNVDTDGASRFLFTEDAEITVKIHEIMLEDNGGLIDGQDYGTDGICYYYCTNYPGVEIAFPTMVKEEHTHLGWSKSAEATVADYAPDCRFADLVGEDDLLYAVWQLN